MNLDKDVNISVFYFHVFHSTWQCPFLDQGSIPLEDIALNLKPQKLYDKCTSTMGFVQNKVN